MERRTFIKAASLAALAVASGVGIRTGYAQQVPNSSGTEPPKLKVPPGACDCHMHIFDPTRFAPRTNRPVTPNYRCGLPVAAEASRNDAQYRRDPAQFRQ